MPAKLTTADSLLLFYGLRFARLSKEHKQALVEDVEELKDFESESSTERAINVLNMRIGGKLESYVLCLVLGQQRRGLR